MGEQFTDVEFRYPWAGSLDQTADRPASEDWASILIPETVKAPVTAVSVICDESPVCGRFVGASTSTRLNSAGSINVSAPPGQYSLPELVTAATVDDADARLAVYQGRLAVRCVNSASGSIDIAPPGVLTPHAHAAWFGWIPRVDPTNVSVNPGSAIFLDDLSLVPAGVIARAEQGIDHVTDPIVGSPTLNDPETTEYVTKRFVLLGRSNSLTNSLNEVGQITDSTALWADRLGIAVGTLTNITENLSDRTATISTGGYAWLPFNDTETSRRDNVYRRTTEIREITASTMTVGWRSEGSTWTHPVVYGRVDGIVRWQGKYKELERPVILAGKFVNLAWGNQNGNPIYERGARACAVRLHH